MGVSDADIRHLLTQPEGQQLEFKSGRSILKRFRNSLPQTIAGFANAEGGVILFGNPKTARTYVGPHNPLLGLDDAEPVRRAVQLAIKEVEPTPPVDMSVHDIDGQTYVAVEIPPRTDPPYFGAGAAVVRVDDRLQPLSLQRLRAMIAHASARKRDEALKLLIDANDRQTRQIEGLRSEIARATSTSRQIAFGIAFTVLGAGLGAIVSSVVH